MGDGILTHLSALGLQTQHKCEEGPCSTEG
jgi:hypothetical protein